MHVALKQNHISNNNSNYKTFCGRPESLYLSSSGMDSENNCTNPSNPCETWSHVVSKFDAGNSLFIDSGVYDVYQGITVNSVSLGGLENVSVSSANSVLKTVANYVVLFYFYASIFANLNVQISDLVYLPTNTFYGRFGYFVYLNSVETKNVVVNGSVIAENYFIYNLYDTVYAGDVDSFVVDNMNIIDMNRRDGNNYYIFYIYYCEYVSLQNINYTTSNDDNTYYAYFAFFDENDYSNMIFESIFFENYSILYGFYIVDNDYSTIVFSDVEFNSVYGEYLFYIYSNYNAQTNISNLIVDGINPHNGTIDSSILYCAHNAYGTLRIDNSIFRNMTLGSSGIAFYF